MICACAYCRKHTEYAYVAFISMTIYRVSTFIPDGGSEDLTHIGDGVVVFSTVNYLFIINVYEIIFEGLENHKIFNLIISSDKY